MVSQREVGGKAGWMRGQQALIERQGTPVPFHTNLVRKVDLVDVSRRQVLLCTKDVPKILFLRGGELRLLGMGIVSLLLPFRPRLVMSLEPSQVPSKLLAPSRGSRLGQPCDHQMGALQDVVHHESAIVEGQVHVRPAAWKSGMDGARFRPASETVA